jgi:Interferon-induced transmembrane protein
MLAYRAKRMATMSYGDNPAGEQEYDTGPTFGAPPSYADQSGYGQPGSTPPTYRALGIIAVICGVLFNLILGLPAAFVGRRYSDQVSPLWANGNVQAAVQASRKARAWLIASFVLDVLGLILVVVLIFQGSSSNFNNPSLVAASIKTQVQQRLSDSSGPDYDPGVTVTSVACTRAGTTTDHCVIRLSTGEADTVTATISGNGTGYSTH